MRPDTRIHTYRRPARRGGSGTSALLILILFAFFIVGWEKLQEAEARAHPAAVSQ